MKGSTAAHQKVPDTPELTAGCYRNEGPDTPECAMAENAGFEAITHMRNAANKEKKVDASLTTELLRDAYKNAKPNDVFKLVAGDGDYIPAVQRLVQDGFHVEVLFWDHASKELTEACTKFTSIRKHLKWLEVYVKNLI